MKDIKKHLTTHNCITALIFIFVLLCVADIRYLIIKNQKLNDERYKTLNAKMDLYNEEYLLATEHAEELVWVENARSRQPFKFDYSWMYNNRLIGHAMGGIDDVAYTNSREAFEVNYAKGYRVFEVDFDLTDEEYAVVTAHSHDDWINNQIIKKKKFDTEDGLPLYSLDNYTSDLIDDKYHHLTGRDIIDLLAEYKDIYIITDSKYTDVLNSSLEFSQIIRYAKDTDPSVLRRLIPQVYNENMFWNLMELYQWNSVILTLYTENWSKTKINNTLSRTGIKFVTVKYSEKNVELIKYLIDKGYIVACHTINDDAIARMLIDMGVTSLYTDFLDPKAYK